MNPRSKRRRRGDGELSPERDRESGRIRRDDSTSSDVGPWIRARIHLRLDGFGEREMVEGVSTMNAHSEGHNAFDNTICPRCGKPRPDVEERWSSGVYVGKFCAECSRSDRDNCEIDQGDVLTD